MLFSGCPCQVAALKNALRGQDTKRLYLVDLLCHGAPSQKIFDAFIAEEEERYGEKIRDVHFHHKYYLWWRWTTRNIRFRTESGKEHIQFRYFCNYLRAYHPRLMNRLSCYDCIFARPERQGDITIGDFWGISLYYPQLCVEHGVSRVQANTKKGAAILAEMKARMDWYPIDRQRYARQSGGELVVPGGVSPDPRREKFLRDLRGHGMAYAARRAYPMRADMLRHGFGLFKRLVRRILVLLHLMH